MSQQPKDRFEAKLVGMPLIVSILSTTIAAYFLLSLIRFTPDQAHHLVMIAAGLFPVLLLAARVTLRRRETEIIRYWKSVEQGKAPAGDTEVRALFACVMNHPRYLLIHGMCFWGIGTALAAALMLIFEDLPAMDLLKICFSGVSTGVLSSVLTFFGVKELLDPVRASFHRYGQVRNLGEGVSHVSLRTKLVATLVSLVFITLSFLALVFYEQTLQMVEESKVEGSLSALERLRGDLTRLPVDDAFKLDLDALSRRAGLPSNRMVALLDAGGNPLAWGGEVSVPEGAARLKRPGRRALLEMEVAGKPWRLALFAPTGLPRGAAGDLKTRIGVQLLLSLGIAMGLAMLAARDLNKGLEKMADWSQGVASGDLGASLRFESEDELGILARSLTDMSDRLRQMILHVRENTEGVERMSAEVSSMSHAVMDSSDEQSSSVLEATSVFEEINASIKGIAEHTEHLSVSAEESSSSILEMGATVEEVSGNVESLSRSVDESVTSVEQMASSIREVARNVEGLSEVAEETNASMEEMAASIRQVEENALQTRRLSVDMVEAAETGSERVRATISGIESIRSGSEEARQVITKLGARAEEIGEILNVIDEVAEETNLLALNAAIIAAQAGEHGRGFSVVADEIKDLADRVGASTKEIGKLIKAVQDESENAINSVRRGAERVAEGERLSREAGKALEDITSSARRSGEMIGEIAQTTTEQSKGSRSVVNAMERVREMVAQIRGAMAEQSRGSEQVMAASMSMRDVAQQVRGTIHEQARGSGRITASIENIREMVQQINGAIQEQRRGTEQAVVALEHIRERAEHNQEAALKMTDVVKTMVSGADVLKREVDRFRLGDCDGAAKESTINGEGGSA